LDEIDKTADEALAEITGRDGGKDADRSSVGEAMRFLRDVLADGAVSSVNVFRQAKEAGISKPTLNRAKRALRIESKHRGEGGATRGRGEWIWELPKSVSMTDE
jgi:putative DNA primase/helicase